VKFAVKEFQSDLARRFWQESRSATVYIHPEVVESLSHECRWFFLLKGDEPVLMWPIATNFQGVFAPPTFTYFFGPHWADTVGNRAVSTRHRFHLDGMNAMIDFLLDRYSQLQFSLAPEFLDVRPFTWWNYGGQPDNKFLVEPMYTAQITSLKEKSDDCLLRDFRSVRRQEVRRLENNGEMEIVRDVPWCDVVAVYADVMAKSEIEVEAGEPGLVGLGKLIESGWGFALGSRRKGEKEIGSVSVILRAKRVAHVVLMGARSGFRERGVGAWTTFQTLRFVRKLGDQVVDFNGANSPNRGDDKHSYGAVEKLYFQLSYGEAAGVH
jgi:hypothetical protein